MVRHPAAAVVTLTCLFSGAPSAWGQGCPLPAAREAYSDPTNAALVYLQAWAGTPRELTQRANDEYKREVGWRPSKELAAALSEHPAAMTEVMRASKIDGADWGVTWSAGLNALLPHVGQLRSSARLLSADARRLVEEGKADEGAERVGAMFRVARHATSEPVMIGSLVAAAIDADAASAVEVVLGSKKLSDSARRSLVEAARVLDGSDPYAIKTALGAERRWSTEWIRRCFVETGRMGEMVNELAPMGEGNEEALRQIGAMDKATAAAEVEKLDEFFEKSLGAWDAADAHARLTELEARVKRGEFGLLAKVFAPSVVTCHTRGTEAVQRRAALLERLRAAGP